MAGKKIFSSEIARGGTMVEIEADITGVSRLFLVTDDSGDGKNSDWGNWIDPVLIGADGGATRLTDLVWLAAGSEWGGVNVDKNAAGRPMKIASGSSAFGIGTHANATIRYDIAGRGFTKLIARGAIDFEKAKSGAGSVRFDLYGVMAKSGGELDAQAIARMEGDAKRGEALYAGAATCFACHKHGEVGADIGPELSGIGQKFGREVILENILNPSASIAFGYETVVVETEAGETHSGFLVADADPVILKDIAGRQHRIPRGEIKSRSQQSVSIMPPASALGLNAQQLADLVEFLMQKQRG